LGLAAHLLDEDSIGSFRIRVPFCSHRCGDGESRDRVWLTGQEEEGRLLGAGIYLPYSFLFVDIGSVEMKLGHANKQEPKKGKRLR
jgi:hypothetical protein